MPSYCNGFLLTPFPRYLKMVFSEHALEKQWKTSQSHAKVIPNLRKPMDFKGKVQQKVPKNTERLQTV